MSAGAGRALAAALGEAGRAGGIAAPLATRTAPAKRTSRILRRARRGADRLVTIALCAVVLVLAALALGWLSGHRVMIDRSDSMAPAIRAGDLVLTREVPAHRVAPGEVVTFGDPVRDRSVTHRVVDRRLVHGRWAFLTRGDANTRGERWSVAASEQVARVSATVPRAGFVVASLTAPAVRLVLITVCGVALCGLALRAIWRP